MSFDWEDNEDWFELSVPERAAMLKTAVTMTDVIELCGHDVVNDKVRPPWNPTERTPSTHIYEDHFYDFGSGRHGDIFDWVAEEDLAGGEGARTLGESIGFLRRLALRGGKEPGDVDAVPVRKLEDLSQYMPVTNAEVVAGVDVSRFFVSVDADNNILVAHYEPHTVYGIKVRRAGGGKSSIPGSQFTHRLYSPVGWVDEWLHRGPTAVICEGESDSWAMFHQLDHLGVDVFALPSGSASWKDHWLEDLAPYSQVLLCFDNDRAGKSALEKVTRKVGFDRAKELKVPAIYNDAREAIAAGWRPGL